MILHRLSTQILLSPQDLPATRDDFEVIGVFNPGAVQVQGKVVLLVRVAERPRENRHGYIGLPRWDTTAGLITDWVPTAEWERVDARIYRKKSDGRLRLTFTSYLRVVHCVNGRAVRTITNHVMLPEGELEEYGVEDPRITLLEGRFYFTYVAISRHGPSTALASTSDFQSFMRHGIIFCAENKDVVLFPDRLAGKFTSMHRPVCGSPFTRPEIWTASSPDLIHWGHHMPLRLPVRDWLSGRVGAGPPPIRVPEGWLLIFHGNRPANHPGEVGTYSAGALLLDSNEPNRILKQTMEPFMRPEMDFEINGFVPNVVFPTATISDGENLLVYYGAADECTAVAEYDTRTLLEILV